MSAVFSPFRNWKHRRWKYVKPYAAFRYQSTQQPLPDVISWNVRMNDYVQLGDLDSARKLFDQVPQRTVVSWNTMISGYVKWGRTGEALGMVSDMHKCGVRLNETTFSTILGSSSGTNAAFTANMMHGVVYKSGYESFEFVGTSLISCYLSCGEIENACMIFGMLHDRHASLWGVMLVGYVKCNLMYDALQLFWRMPSRDVISWTAVIAGYAQSEGECRKALELFHVMRMMGEAEPNEFTLDSTIRACGRLQAFRRGEMVHGLVTRLGFGEDCSVSGALVDLYCKCNAVEDAGRIYDRLRNPSINESNSLIDGLISVGKIEDAEMILRKMVKPSPVSYNLMIKGYGQSGRVGDAKNLFDTMPNRTIVSSNTMISVYCQNFDFEEALKLFYETKLDGNTVTWNSMISGYIQLNRAEEALKIYLMMHQLRVQGNRSTFSTLFHACSCLGALQQGKLLHAHVVKTPFVSNVYVGTSLIDMYAKCGSISDAQTAFGNIPFPNVAAWTALLNGYAHHGFGTEATLLFERMIEQGVRPNVITFVGLLLACSRAGLVEEGLRYFDLMKNKYGLMPSQEHFACVVDLLGRSGHLEEAEKFIHEMPVPADCVVWGALLSACWFFMDLETGERVAQRLMSLNPKQISVYVLASNIYAGLGRWEEVLKTRKRLRTMEVKKDPGCSWIEVNNTVHVFSVEDRNHPCCNEIYRLLEELIPNVYCNLHTSFNLHHFECHGISSLYASILTGY